MLPVKRKTPRELRDDVLSLIQEDIEQIKTGSRAFDSDTAQDLCRYSNTLLNIIKDQLDEGEESRKALSKMSNEELMQKARDALAKMEQSK